MNLYVTADQIGGWTGGSQVTFNEAEALLQLGPCEVWDRKQLKDAKGEDPWLWDEWASEEYVRQWYSGFHPKLTHFYAGTFSQMVRCLKHRGCKVSYTAAAHDVGLSRREHERLGIPFNYPHLTDPVLWRRYLAGYMAADLVVCPSEHSRAAMQSYGCKNVAVVPHGVGLPGDVRALPPRFTVGYLGSFGPDKGVRYLLEAWKKLDYRDDSVLMLGGRDSTSEWTLNLLREFGGGNVALRGWVDKVEDFYADCSVYCQPSVTEGFGMETLEAASCARPVLCSQGAGSCDLFLPMWQFPAADVEALAAKIDLAWEAWRNWTPEELQGWRRIAENHTWPKIQARYVELWESLL